MITSIYISGAILWVLFWWKVVTIRSFRTHKLLVAPFILCLFFLVANMLISGSDQHVAEIELEESLFNFLDIRAGLAIEATAAVLVVAAIVYGLTIHQIPKLFIKLESYAFISLIGLMAPVTWIPTDNPEMLMLLRHMQTIPFLWGLFLAVGGITVLLDDVQQYSMKDAAEPSNEQEISQ